MDDVIELYLPTGTITDGFVSKSNKDVLIKEFNVPMKGLICVTYFCFSYTY